MLKYVKNALILNKLLIVLNLFVYLHHETATELNLQKLAKMKTTKRFTTTEIVNYRLSNTIRRVSFDTIEEAKSHVENEREKHPRSKKFRNFVIDSTNNKRYYF